MKEDLLQYAWLYRLYDDNQLQTVDGEPISVINVGELNRDAGPDFFNVKVKIGGTIWAGNVEIHVAASDWHKHHHDEDPRYDSVVLHVVDRSDTRIRRANGDLIPQVEMRLDAATLAKYEDFRRPHQWIHCEKHWERITHEYLQLQLCRMLHLRLSRKTEEIFTLLKQNRNNWSEVFYRLLAKSFGMHTNALPFDQLAQSLPLPCLAKHKDHPEQLEALFFGQAGLLETTPSDDYEALLQREYNFLRHKFGLTPIDPSLWKFARMRPNNSPYVRIAQLASLVHQSNNLFSKVLEMKNPSSIRQTLQTDVSPYWHTHMKFGATSPTSTKRMSDTTLDLLIINAVCPALYAYAIQKEDEETQDRMMTILEQIPAERNHTVEGWKRFGLCVETAFQSQALIELKTQYCDMRKCLQCSIGHKLLARKCGGEYLERPFP